MTARGRRISWDEPQKRVIEAGRTERVLVSAGPGMGKTAVACARVSYLIEDEFVSDTNIWLVSFTRAAIAEIRNRIAECMQTSNRVPSIMISTIDSQAWKLRYGFSPEEAERLFGGFETGIASARALLADRADDIRDAFGDLEHLIIDEAQDITGERARFLLDFIALLPADCGLSVFHDPAQAIYDQDEDEEPFRFTEGLRGMLGAQVGEHSLTRIHRTDVPALLRVYGELRDDILSNPNVGGEQATLRVDLVKSAAASVGEGSFDMTALSAHTEPLVLFRRRIEVLQASAFMARAGLPHRLRMSGLPRVLHPWLAAVLGSTTGRQLGYNDFLSLHAAASVTTPHLMNGKPKDDAEARWLQLRQTASAQGSAVDLKQLRAVLASHPPDDYVLSEFGHVGPILGTIHASKGREADDVFLQINRNWGDGWDALKLAEESRVLFVGATRARRSLAVQGGFRMPYAQSTRSGRSYRASPNYRHGYQLQVGLSGDFDAFSVASVFSMATSFDGKPLYCDAMLERGTWIYSLTMKDGTPLGSVSSRLSSDILEIGAMHPSRPGTRSPDRINGIYVLGYGSAVAAVGDDRLSRLKGAAASSGFWLIPQIAGLPMAFMK